MTHDQEAAWLAGFIDGEGTIMLYVSHPKSERHPHIQSALRVANTIEDNIKVAKAIMSRMAGREVRYKATRQSVVGYRPLYRLDVDRQADIVTVIGAMLPFLVGKRPQADLMLEYLAIAPSKSGGSQSRGTSYTDTHFEYVSRMRHLNRRYAKGEWWDSQRETERLAPMLGEETIRPATQVAEALGN